ncbi:MAG: ANTAR domain-containing response regulator [Planctomycetaceae bacterium]
MSEPLRIAVADDEPDMRDFFCKILPHLGYDVVAVAENGRQLVEDCRQKHPDLIITDIEMPEMDGLDAAREIGNEHAIPVILVTAHSEPEMIERASKAPVLAYLVKPIRKEDLPPAIGLAMQRNREFQALQQQAEDTRQALIDRKLIERAKGILMKRSGLPEPDAFRRLQKLSSDKNRKMVDVAQMIIIAEEAMEA